MNMKFHFSAFLVVLAVILSALAFPIPGIAPDQAPIQSAHASPIFVEDDFDALTCDDGDPPPGWSFASSLTARTDECDDSQSFPNSEFTSPEAYDGSHAYKITKADFTCCPFGTSSTSVGSGATTANDLSFGFAFRYRDIGITPIGLSDACNSGVEIGIRELSQGGPTICVDGDATPNQNIDSLFVSTASGWSDTGINLVNNTWYLFRFDINRVGNTYSTYMNDTLIASGTSTDPDDDYNIIHVLFRGGRADLNADTEFWMDWFFSDEITIDTQPDIDTNLCLPDVSRDVETDASTDVIFGMSTAPAWLDIDIQTGQITGTAPSVGTFPVVVTANVSTGQDTEPFNINVVSVCTQQTFLTTFGPNWVAFFAIIGILGYIVYRFRVAWRKRGRNRKVRRGQWWKGRIRI